MLIVVVDTNIIFSALLKEKNKFKDFLIGNNDITFIAPNKIFVEIFNHKEKMIKFTDLSNEKVLEMLLQILNKINFIKDLSILKNYISEAYKLTFDVDLNDIISVAIALEYNALLWTSDKILKKGLLNKGFDKFFVF